MDPDLLTPCLDPYSGAPHWSQMPPRQEEPAWLGPSQRFAPAPLPSARPAGRNQDGAITTWACDATNRLVSQILSGARASFTYDSVGNILVKHQEASNPITMVYDSANRIETSQQGAVVTTYTSDANGNLTAQNAGGSKTTFTYDNENRLKTIQHADATLSSYTYAGGFPVQGEGLRRTRHQPGGSLTTTIWDGSDYLMEKGGGSTVRYVVSEGEMLAEKRSGVRLAFVPDPLGSVIGLLNSSQAFTDTFGFWPYGEVRARTGSTPTPFQWVGAMGYYQELEWLYYIRARCELAVLGRWLTQDPARDEGPWYRLSNPISIADTLGLIATHSLAPWAPPSSIRCPDDPSCSRSQNLYIICGNINLKIKIEPCAADEDLYACNAPGLIGFTSICCKKYKSSVPKIIQCYLPKAKKAGGYCCVPRPRIIAECAPGEDGSRV